MNANANDLRPQIERLRELRQAAGISQEGLARLAGCSTSTVRLVERGWRPSLAMGTRLAIALEKATPRVGHVAHHCGTRASDREMS
jgi:transcriptional regulator with XRE-family HTH domain